MFIYIVNNEDHYFVSYDKLYTEYPKSSDELVELLMMYVIEKPEIFKNEPITVRLSDELSDYVNFARFQGLAMLAKNNTKT